MANTAKKQKGAKRYDVPTTNFVLDLNKIDIPNLQAKYQLFTVEVPDSFRYFAQNSNINAYGLLHNTYKEQLELPYYFFTFAKPKPTIFILRDKSVPEKPTSLTLDFLDSKPILAQEKDIAELCTQENLHILAKLFLADFFFNYKKTHRICQHKFYIHSYKSETGFKPTSLEVGISQIKGTTEFYIDQKATYLLKADKSKINEQYVSSDFYCELVDNLYYRQVKTSNVKQWLADKKDERELWKVFTGSQTDKPSIKWFEDYDNITRCKSYLLQDFQTKLIKYYNQVLGKTCAKQQVYKMEQIIPISHSKIQGYAKETGLFVKLLKEVGLLDLRFKEIDKPNANDFQEYVSFFNTHYGKEYGIQFSAVTLSDLERSTKPILVLIDTEKQLFEPAKKDKSGKEIKKSGFLNEAGFSVFDDPKQKLYNQYATTVPLQSLNVNINEAEKHTRKTYFDYEVLGKSLLILGKNFDEIKAKISQEEKSIKEAYAEEKEKYGKDNVTEATQQRKKQNDYLKKYISLTTNKIEVCLYDLLLKHYIVNQVQVGRNFDNPTHSLPLITSIPNLLNYAYMHQNHLMYIDQQNYTLKFIDLQSQVGKEQRIKFLAGLGLDWISIENQFAERNYTRENGQDIINRFGNKTENGIKNTRFVFSKHLALAIEGTEERVLHKYDPNKKDKSQRAGENKTALEGIFFSEEKQIYTVGYKSMDMTADDSVIVRNLFFYQKPDNFKTEDIKTFLQTLTVLFVKNQQYTVYPYFFDLLRLYQEDILRTN